MFFITNNFHRDINNNIPVILIYDRNIKLGRKKIYKNFLNTNIVFNSFQKAFEFINLNWKILISGGILKTQKAKIYF